MVRGILRGLLGAALIGSTIIACNKDDAPPQGDTSSAKGPSASGSAPHSTPGPGASVPTKMTLEHVTVGHIDRVLAARGMTVEKTSRPFHDGSSSARWTFDGGYVEFHDFGNRPKTGDWSSAVGSADADVVAFMTSAKEAPISELSAALEIDGAPGRKKVESALRKAGWTLSSFETPDELALVDIVATKGTAEARIRVVDADSLATPKPFKMVEAPKVLYVAGPSEIRDAVFENSD